MKTKSAFTLIAAIFTLAAVVGCGAFGISYLRREYAKETREMKRLEVQRANLKRETEFWETQIARSKDPSALRIRAGEALRAPDAGQIIRASRVIDSAGKQVYAATFRQSPTTRTASTAQR